MRARPIIEKKRIVVAREAARGWQLLVLAALLTLVMALTAFPARPVAAAETMQSFEAAYEIRADGFVDVTEVITWDFGTSGVHHGIFRDLIVRADCGEPREGAEQPLSPCPSGHERRWPVSAISVESAPAGGEFAPVPYTSSRVGDALQLKIGDANVEIVGVWQYRIRYTIEGALDAYESHDEFYWDATGTWPVTMLTVSVSVRLPDGAEMEATCYQGDAGSSEPCIVTPADGEPVTRFDSGRWLGPGEQLTIVVGWQKGLVEVPPPLVEDVPSVDDYFELDAAEWGGAAVVGALSFAGVGALWWSKGRDRRYKKNYYLTNDPTEGARPVMGHDPVVVEFLPPEDLRPAQMGVILDERADPLDVTATIVDLAVRGYIHISETEETGGFLGIGAKQDWMLTKKKPSDAELESFEKEIMSGLFETGDEVRLSDLTNRFYKHLDDAQDRLYSDAMKRKWFDRRPKTTKLIWAFIGVGVVLAGVALTVAMGFWAGRAIIGMPLILAGVLLIILSPSMPRRTAAGSEALRRVLGFRLYVATAETRQHEFNEQQNIFARYLPYAIVFGCVNKWAKAFEGLDDRISQETASWYTGAHAFHVAAFSSSLQGLSSSVTSTVQSSPSSSGSGFSGGGAGGGGGGGGGGSW